MRIKRGRHMVNLLIIVGLICFFAAAVVATQAPTKVEAEKPH